MERISRILLVVPNYQDVKSILEKNRYQIEDIVDNGEDALRVLENTKIDLVIVHSELKGEMNGLETINAILTYHPITNFLLTDNTTTEFIKSIKHPKVMGVVFEPIHEPTFISTLELGFDRYHDYVSLFNEAKKFKNFVEESPSATAIFQKGFCRYANSRFTELFSSKCDNVSNISTFKFLKILELSAKNEGNALKSEENGESLDKFLYFNDKFINFKRSDGSLKLFLYKSRSYMFKERLAHIVSFIELPSNLIQDSKILADDSPILISPKMPITPPVPPTPLVLPEILDEQTNFSSPDLSESAPSEKKDTPDIDIISEFLVFAEILGNRDRFLILDCLRTQSYDIYELAVIIGKKSTDTVYKHLRILAKKKVIIKWKDGNTIKYSLNRSFFETLISSWRSFYNSLELWFGAPL
ncbi:MAG: response regulator [Promethearchaeota archaeon]